MKNKMAVILNGVTWIILTATLILNYHTRKEIEKMERSLHIGGIALPADTTMITLPFGSDTAFTADGDTLIGPMLGPGQSFRLEFYVPLPVVPDTIPDTRSKELPKNVRKI